MNETLVEGWTWLHNSPKWHYFRESISLCGRWMLLGSYDFEQDDKFGNSKNCKACERKRKREVEGK